jgi:hypothetical protein
VEDPDLTVGLNQLLCDAPEHCSDEDGSDATLEESLEASPTQVEEVASNTPSTKNPDLTLPASTSKINVVSVRSEADTLSALDVTKKQYRGSSDTIFLPNALLEQVLGWFGDFSECKIPVINAHTPDVPFYFIARIHHGSQVIQVLKAVPAEIIAEEAESCYPTVHLSRRYRSRRPSKLYEIPSSSGVVPYTSQKVKAKIQVLPTMSEQLDSPAEEIPEELWNKTALSPKTEVLSTMSEQDSQAQETPEEPQNENETAPVTPPETSSLPSAGTISLPDP